MRRFAVQPTPLQGLQVIDRLPIQDERGFFARFFCAQDLAEAGFNRSIAQINHTLTRRKGAARGLHFQHAPHAEIKMVSCLRGEVFDVAVDLRRGSPTFLQWHAEILSADNMRSLLIPEGFAHGFQALTDDCELLYLHSAPFHAGAEGAVNLLDPRVAIRWPLPLAETSPRDAGHPMLTDSFDGI